jgi:hypothetical protein
MRFSGPCLASLLLLLPAVASAVPAAPGLPRFVHLVSLEGSLCSDDAARGEFMTGFRGAFAESSLPTARAGARPGSTVGGASLSNRFRLLEGGTGEGCWQVQVVADTLPRQVVPLAGIVRTIVSILSPEAIATNARALPERIDLAFEVKHHSPRRVFRDAGRVVALRVLERLHREIGDLRPGEVLRPEAESFRGQSLGR